MGAAEESRSAKILLVCLHKTENISHGGPGSAVFYNTVSEPRIPFPRERHFQTQTHPFPPFRGLSEANRAPAALRGKEGERERSYIGELRGGKQAVPRPRDTPHSRALPRVESISTSCRTTTSAPPRRRTRICFNDLMSSLRLNTEQIAVRLLLSLPELRGSLARRESLIFGKYCSLKQYSVN